MEILPLCLSCFAHWFQRKQQFVCSENKVCVNVSPCTERSVTVTCSILEMSQGRAPLWASSTIFCLVESGSGLPLTNTPPSWFTPLWPTWRQKHQSHRIIQQNQPKHMRQSWWFSFGNEQNGVSFQDTELQMKHEDRGTEGLSRYKVV